MPLRHRLHRVVYIPLDDRPVNLRMPQLLAQMVEYELLTPPVELLGNFHTPGQPEQIAEWLEAQLAEPADCALISLDMLAYGGLMASRKTGTPGELAQQRLQVLGRLRQIAPDVTIYASSVILGQAPTAVANEIGESRELLGEYSQLKAAVDAEDSPAQRQALERLEDELPAAVRDRYLSVRTRNHKVNRLAIEQIAAGNIDFLALTQDDAREQGLHIAEQQRLHQRVSELGLGDRVMIYPGADEVGMTLLARFVHQHMEKQPVIRVIYAGEAATNIAPFEDRPFTEVVAAQVTVVGGRMAAEDEEAALTVLVSPPAGLTREEATDTAVYEQRLARLSAAVRQVVETSSRRGIAICDAAFPNGADDVFLKAMGVAGGVDLSQVLSYGAWNTASNSVGSVLAHSTLRLTALQDKGAFDLVHLFGSVAPMRYLTLLNSLINAQRAHIQFLFTRLVDDWLYQAQIRRVVTRQMTQLVQSSAFDLQEAYSHAEQMVRNGLTEATTNLWIDRFMDKPCAELGPEADRGVLRLAEMEEMHVKLPWRRLFEVDLDFKLNMELVAKD